MKFKTNYRQQRSERTRIQNERRQEKFQKRQEAVAKRKAVRLGGGTLKPLQNNGSDPQGAKTGTRNGFYRVLVMDRAAGDHGRLVWRQMAAGVRKDGAFGESEN